jgi:hypothetical protein
MRGWHAGCRVYTTSLFPSESLSMSLSRSLRLCLRLLLCLRLFCLSATLSQIPDQRLLADLFHGRQIERDPRALTRSHGPCSSPHRHWRGVLQRPQHVREPFASARVGNFSVPADLGTSPSEVRLHTRASMQPFTADSQHLFWHIRAESRGPLRLL